MGHDCDEEACLTVAQHLLGEWVAWRRQTAAGENAPPDPLLRTSTFLHDHGETWEAVAEGRPVRKAERVGGWDGTVEERRLHRARCWCGTMKRDPTDVACCRPHELLAGRMG